MELCDTIHVYDTIHIPPITDISGWGSCEKRSCQFLISFGDERCKCLYIQDVHACISKKYELGYFYVCFSINKEKRKKSYQREYWALDQRECMQGV